VTLAPRIATGEHEPSYIPLPAVGLTMVSALPHDVPNGIGTDGRYHATGSCPSCAHIAPNTINLNSTSQPFIYAVGPGGIAMQSNGPYAPLRRHWYYGNFNMDMTKAVGNGVPMLGNKSDVVIGNGNSSRTLDWNWTEMSHAWLMVFVTLIVFPLGIVVLRIFQNVRNHLYIQSAGFVLFLTGAMLGGGTSYLYQRVRL
jgi:hypothetical protein